MEQIRLLLVQLRKGLDAYVRHEVETRILLVFMEAQRQERKDMTLALKLFREEEGIGHKGD